MSRRANDGNDYRRIKENVYDNGFPFTDQLPKDVIHVLVKNGSKMRNLLEFALKSFDNQDQILLSAYGPAMGKLVSIVELIKRKKGPLYQWNRLTTQRLDECYRIASSGLGEDDSFVNVKRHSPSLYVILTKNVLDVSLPGVQGPEPNDDTSEQPAEDKEPVKDGKPTTEDEDLDEDEKATIEEENSAEDEKATTEGEKPTDSGKAAKKRKQTNKEENSNKKLKTERKKIKPNGKSRKRKRRGPPKDK